MARPLLLTLAVVLQVLLVSSISTLSTNPDHQHSQQEECGFYLAPSTIPGAGLGAFAGKSLDKGTLVSSLADVVIPLQDVRLHYGQDYVTDTRAFILNDYVWSSDMFHGMEEEFDEEVDAFSPGLGAIPNGLSNLANMADVPNEEEHVLVDSAGLHRISDPGVGAFSKYHNRAFQATTNIVEGAEIFFDYGEAYFNTREALELVPLSEDYERADEILEEYKHLQEKANHSSILLEKLWDLTTSFPWESRTMSALPSNHTKIDVILQQDGTAKQFYEDSIRDVEWLQQHGQCMDRLRPGPSKIPQAGRGAFASRNIQKGELVAPAPLLHIPDKRRLALYEKPLDLDSGEERDPNEIPMHQQVLLNYCWGHRYSTLLLCPYGPLTSLINHSPQEANTRIQWSKNMAHSEWRQMPVWDMESEAHAGLAFDYVALRDIQEGEEILVDYGDEWETAWQQHVRNWEAPVGAEKYRAAFELNQDENLVVATVDDEDFSYSSRHVRQYCHETYRLTNGLPASDNDLHSCRALLRYTRENATLYSAEVFTLVEQGGSSMTSLHVEILFDLPRDAFTFADAPRTRDHHMNWSFRHEMSIPNDMFPWQWKNRKVYCFLWYFLLDYWKELMDLVRTFTMNIDGRIFTIDSN